MDFIGQIIQGFIMLMLLALFIMLVSYSPMLALVVMTPIALFVGFVIYESSG